jgi:flagellar motor switch protein FliN
MSKREGETPVVPNEGEETPAPAQFGEVGSGGAKGKTEASAGPGSIDMLMDVNLNVRIELGRTRMSVEDILKLQGGSVVTLDKLAGDFVDVLVNDKLVARGEVLILNDRFCVRVAEIFSPEERRDVSQA